MPTWPEVVRMELLELPDLLGLMDATSKAGGCARRAAARSRREHSSFISRFTSGYDELFHGGGTIRNYASAECAATAGGRPFRGHERRIERGGATDGDGL